MKVGKVSETILKRSIFKQIHTKRDEVLLGAGVGEDCAAMKLAPGEIFVISALWLSRLPQTIWPAAARSRWASCSQCFCPRRLRRPTLSR